MYMSLLGLVLYWTMLANFHIWGIMFFLRAVVNMFVRRASSRGPMCFRCLMRVMACLGSVLSEGYSLHVVELSLHNAVQLPTPSNVSRFYELQKKCITSLKILICMQHKSQNLSKYSLKHHIR